MAYGSNSNATASYGGLIGSLPNPNADVSLGDLGAGGVLALVLNALGPSVNGTSIDLSDLGTGGVLTLFLNKNADGTIRSPFSDAGELWRRVPRT